MMSVFGGAVNTFLFCCSPYCFVLSASVCMYVCEWRVLMASVLGFSSRFFPYKVFLLVFSLGEVGLLPPK